jgi:hypothetical protein
LSFPLLARRFSYQLMLPEEMAEYCPISAATLMQRISVPFHQTYAALRHFLSQMFDLDPHTSLLVPESVFNVTASGKAALAERHAVLAATAAATAADATPATTGASSTAAGSSSSSSTSSTAIISASATAAPTAVRKHSVPCVTIGHAVHVLQLAADHVVCPVPLSCPVWLFF